MFHLHLVTDSRIAAFKAAGQSVGTAVGSDLTKAVTIAAQIGNPIGAAALAAANAAELSGKTGAEKKVDVLAAVVPVIVAEAAKGGFAAVIADAEQFGGLVIEEVVSNMKTTPIGLIASAVLHSLGIG